MVIADVICWGEVIRVGPVQNDWYSYKWEILDREACKQGECHEKMKAEIGMIILQAKEHQRLQKQTNKNPLEIRREACNRFFQSSGN